MELTEKEAAMCKEGNGSNKTQKRKNPFNTQQRKEEKQRRRKKSARLVVRNISFDATEKSLREHMRQWGIVEEVTLLRNSKGNLVGCAFVQYKTVNEAAKAIFKGDKKTFLGRPLYIDWALSKDEYVAKIEVQGEEFEKKKPKAEASGEVTDRYTLSSDDSVKVKNDETRFSSEFSRSNAESEEDGDEDPGDSNQNEEDKNDVEIKLNIPKVKKEKTTSSDVHEGCTVFIKNVPFDATDTDLRKVCRKFGLLYYVIINREPVSGHSKGTAFIKFKNKESADLCLQAGTEFTLLDQVLEPCPALSKDELQNKLTVKSKRDESKDSRNLYLAREGLIMAGCKAAEGVSASDMAKRHKLEQIKTQVLQNLNRFISRNRLSIHNLPLNYDNEKLKKMVCKETGFKPHECRVMRENKITPEYPKGKSKGFGFMSFSTHQEALVALRKLNNNPKIFGIQHRPIVAFSIEDRAVHKIKDKRKQKSKLRNPTFQEKIEKRKELHKLKVQAMLRKVPKGPQADDKQKLENYIKKLNENRDANAKSAQINKKVKPEEDAKYVGTVAKPGSVMRMRSNKKIVKQAQEHKKHIKANKRKEKQQKIRQIQLAEHKTTDRPKQGRQIEHDNLAYLVNKYKRMINSKANESADEHVIKAKKSKRIKWYTE